MTTRRPMAGGRSILGFRMDAASRTGEQVFGFIHVGEMRDTTVHSIERPLSLDLCDVSSRRSRTLRCASRFLMIVVADALGMFRESAAREKLFISTIL